MAVLIPDGRLDFGTECRYAPLNCFSGTECHKRRGATHPGGTDMADEELTTDELLVEEVSIDGMCGVY
jgi:mycofactocin precursor